MAGANLKMLTDDELLAIVKNTINITGNQFDTTLQLHIDEVKDYLIRAGVDEDVVCSSLAAGCISRGVADLWNYGNGDTKLSEYFYQRASQLRGKSASENGLYAKLQEIVKEALEIAKSVRGDADSGKFDGYTPQKGVDYWTVEDKAEIETFIGEKLNEGLANKVDKKYVDDLIEEVESIAKGANQAVSYTDYETMISALNSLPREKYNLGQNIMIVTLDVPDLWVSGIEDAANTYAYISDKGFTDALKENGSVQVGYFVLSPLETQKVELTEYAKKTEIDSLIGDISTAFDELHTYAQTLVGGETE